MPRRPLTLLLTALALLLVAAPASLAAAPAATAAPTARLAVDCADDELLVEQEDGTTVCGEDDLGDDDLDALCEDDWSDDDGEDWGDKGADEEEVSAAVSDDDCAEDGDFAGATISGLQAKVLGRGRGAQVQVGFTLDAADTVELTLARSTAGTASGKRCVVRTAKKGKAAKGKRCTRTTGFGGAVTVAGAAGANTVTPSRWKGRKLKPGTYVLSATTGDGGKTATFKIAAP
ncbi:hypothetical protein VSS74_08730 [Conexibacter stalactiti]|uniref:Uncharacterized protein n=1 Tax=Conexibacter stalactiti TaxID=1940611 RepID=A0ABU4HNX5_9ACTN|nr:hypothetical protein [Conexibacter stalactiti]MDW5594419.1 hypothetical protein [Conexibacter stalactiti]MEC5035061.1 hypothetical protein [Conexibacter stalactiti]